MATNPTSTSDLLFEWIGRDRTGKTVRGELRARGEVAASALLLRQGIRVTRVKRRRMSGGGKKIKSRDLATFTRQLSTMMKAGVPLLQAFDIVGRGNANPRMARLTEAIRRDVETGTSLSNAFRKHPQYFNALYCNLVEAGEAAGILEDLLDRLATYLEKTESIKGKIRSALMYPIVVVAVALGVVVVMMLFVIPSFKQVFTSSGADLPGPTLVVISISEFFTSYWYLIFGVLIGGGYFFFQSWKRSVKMQAVMDRFLLRLPIFGALVRKATIARWTRTLSTMFAAGVPLVDALDSVSGAAGNRVYMDATRRIQQQVTAGTSLTVAMEDAGVFPPMVLQMTAIGEESGSIDHMLARVADFYEEEVDEAVKGLSSLLEPIIIVILGLVIGALVLAMYLPIFKLGQVV